MYLNQAEPLSELSWWLLGGCHSAATPHPQNVGNRQMPGLIIGKTFAGPRFKRLPARFQTATASFPKKGNQAKVLLIFLGSKTLLKPAKPPIDSFHRLLCLFGDCGAGRSTSIDIELVTTFSGETNWINIPPGLRVGMTVVSNRSSRRERLLLIIFVLSVARPVISPTSQLASAHSSSFLIRK